MLRVLNSSVGVGAKFHEWCPCFSDSVDNSVTHIPYLLTSAPIVQYLFVSTLFSSICILSSYLLLVLNISNNFLF